VPQLRFLDSARDNLVEIAGYIAAFGGEDVASRFTGELVDKCEYLQSS
jgi:plasmid stabilization system protein ParE